MRLETEGYGVRGQERASLWLQGGSPSLGDEPRRGDYCPSFSSSSFGEGHSLCQPQVLWGSLRSWGAVWCPLPGKG